MDEQTQLPSAENPDSASYGVPAQHAPPQQGAFPQFGVSAGQPPALAQPPAYGQQSAFGQPAYQQQPQYGTGAGWAQGGMQPHQAYAPTTDQNVETAHVIIAWVVAVVTLGYMLPWAIAATRGKSNALPIALVNFFTGWFFGVGWIVALVMACGAHQQRYPGQAMNVLVAQSFPYGQQPVVPQQQPAQSAALPPAAWYPAPDGQGQQYWDGRAWTSHRA